MEILSGWVISIVGVVMLTVVADILMPEGQTRKYIKTVMSVITVFVIAQPLPGLLKQENPLEVFNPETIVIDESFVSSVTDMRVTFLENQIESFLEGEGYLNVGVSVFVNTDHDDFVITSAVVNLRKLVIEKNLLHINITDEIQKIVAEYLQIDKGKVTMYEKLS